MQKIAKRPLLTSFLIFALILAHGLYSDIFAVDNFTILLVILVIILPYMPLLSKIKFGDFEAEISHDKIRKVGESAEEIPPQKDDSLKSKKNNDLETLAETEPTLALAKARIEIEKRVKSLADIYLKRSYNQKNLRAMINELTKEQVIAQPLQALLHDVIAVANQAIHGATIRSQDAIQLVEYANRALSELDSIVVDRALQPKSKKIKPEEVSKYQDAEYTLRTVVPLVNEPIINTYRLNQDELYAFLEGYDEYAEFIISLTRARPNKPGEKS